MNVYTTINPDCITNIFLLTDDNNKYGIIINPGSFELSVYKLVKNFGVEIKKILVTQNTIEHTAGIELLKRIYDAEIYAYNENILDYKAVKVREGDIIKEGELELKVIETPISSYDSISYYIEDMIFIGNIFEAGILSSIDEKKGPFEYEYIIIKKKILPLPDWTIIYPSNGPASTIELERNYNPYFQRTSEYSFKKGN